jgi:hypothetical protein
MIDLQFGSDASEAVNGVFDGHALAQAATGCSPISKPFPLEFSSSTFRLPNVFLRDAGVFMPVFDVGNFTYFRLAPRRVEILQLVYKALPGVIVIPLRLTKAYKTQK